MLGLRRLVAVSLVVASAAFSSKLVDNGGCRCLPDDACWPEESEWQALNTSVGGRLLGFRDEMQPCIEDVHSEKCSATLANDTAYWLADQPNGLQNTAFFGGWNISSDHAAYVVDCREEEDFQAATKFALAHNLRVVVKNTGHDWYGRNTAPGSLMLWTHHRKDLTWHDSFVPDGCPDAQGVPAVSVQSGIQFYELYPEAQKAGRLVIGGTCDTVGVAGCWMSGCYGAFSKKFGNGALNMLQARVVLANGSLVTASECSHPDLFWALRGGGGGVAGVVTEFVARTHPTPKHVTGMSVSARANTSKEYHKLLMEGLKVYSKVTQDRDQAPNGGVGFGCTPIAGTDAYDCNFGINIQGYESDPEKQSALLQPLVDYANSQPANGSVYGHASLSSVDVWKPEYFDPAAKWGSVPNGTLPWAQYSGEKGSTTGGGPNGVVGMQSKFIPQHYILTESGRANLATAMMEIAKEIGGASFMTPKGQVGIPEQQQDWFEKTSLNPVILDAAGTLFSFMQLPWLAQVPPSSTILRGLGLNASVGSYSDGNGTRTRAITDLCTAGASGDEAAAVQCLDVWQHELIPAKQLQMDRVRNILDEALPNYDASGKPFSGSYWSETDFFERDFQHSYWGAEKYKKLLAVKKAYDPHALFICHHCVGSEFWTEESNLNCLRNTSTDQWQTDQW